MVCSLDPTGASTPSALAEVVLMTYLWSLSLQPRRVSGLSRPPAMPFSEEGGIITHNEVNGLISEEHRAPPSGRIVVREDLAVCWVG
jgi:hypothetical protein